MPKPTPFDGLLADMCTGLGYCGGPGLVTDFIPARGLVTKSQFVDWVFLAEGMDPRFAEPEHRKIMEAMFVKHVGGQQADVGHFVSMGMERRSPLGPDPLSTGAIDVLSPPVVEHLDGRWELVFWFGAPGNASIPFRDILVRIVALLGDTAELRLDEEDVCVEGELLWEGRAISVYYEYMLGYLMLSAGERAMLDDIAARLAPIVSMRSTE